MFLMVAQDVKTHVAKIFRGDMRQNVNGHLLVLVALLFLQEGGKGGMIASRSHQHTGYTLFFNTKLASKLLSLLSSKES